MTVVRYRQTSFCECYTGITLFFFLQYRNNSFIVVLAAGVMELVDIADLKSAALLERAGSNPALGTIK